MGGIILDESCSRLRVMLVIVLIPFVILITASQANAEYDEYRPTELENNTLYISQDQVGYYYIYPVNPTNLPMELELEFVRSWQIISNIDEIESIVVPPYTFNNTFPVQIEIVIPESGFTGNLFFVEYVVYEKDGDARIRYGPRGMFKVELVPERVPLAAPSWDIVALRASYFTLLTIILIATTVYMFRRYLLKPEEEKKGKQEINR